MKEKMLFFAEKIVAEEDLVNIYNELGLVFENVGLFQLQAACLESIWHINNNNELLIQIGDIMSGKCENPNAAQKAYNIYLKRTNPHLYSQYRKVLIQNGGEFLLDKVICSEKFSELVRIVDRFRAILNIMYYFYQIKEYQNIFDYIEYLKNVQNRIQEYILNAKSYDIKDMEEMDYSLEYLSEQLSKVDENIDLNQLAIMLNQKNECAYINVISSLIDNGEDSNAISYYNDVYCKQFNADKAENLIDLYWKLSDLYSEKEHNYKAIIYKKKAIDNNLKQEVV